MRIRITVLAVVYLSCYAVYAEPSAHGPKEAVTCPPKPNDEKLARRIAGEMFADGDKYIEQNQYLLGLQAFTCSLRMVEHPATVFNISQSADLVSETKSSIDLLQAFVMEFPDAESTDKIREIIADLKKRHGANEPNPNSENTPGDPQATAYTGTSTHGDNDEDPDLQTSKEHFPKRDKAANLALYGYIAGGTGVASLCVAGILFGLQAQAYRDGSDSNSYQNFQDYKATLKNYQTGGIVMSTFGALATAAGVTLIILSKRERAKSSISLIPSPRGLTVLGKF